MAWMPDEQTRRLGLSFSHKSARVLIHRSTLEALGNPAYIRFLCSIRTNRVSVQVCAKEESGAIKVPLRKTRKPITICSLVMQRTLWDACDWNRGSNYRVWGVLYPKHELVEFDLTKAEEGQDEVFYDPACEE